MPRLLAAAAARLATSSEARMVCVRVPGDTGRLCGTREGTFARLWRRLAESAKGAAARALLRHAKRDTQTRTLASAAAGGRGDTGGCRCLGRAPPPPPHAASHHIHAHIFLSMDSRRPPEAAAAAAAAVDDVDAGPAPPAIPHSPLTLTDVLARLGENGYGREAVRCVSICKDARANVQLWERVLDLEHIATHDPSGRRVTRLMHWADVGDVVRVRDTLDRGAKVTGVCRALFAACRRIGWPCPRRARIVGTGRWRRSYHWGAARH